MLSRNAARSLLREVQFPGDEDPTYLIAVSGKRKRRSILAKDGGEEERMVAAAIEIQRVWKGHRIRCKLQLIIGKKSNAGGEKESAEVKVQAPRCLRVTAQYQAYLRWCVDQGIATDSSAVLSFEDYSARIIQSWWKRLRGAGGEVWVSKGRKIPGQGETRRRRRRILDKESAAIAVQRVWRRYNDMKVYRFYRELISFRGHGDPALMLKGINPSEAKLLDRAAGAHVRFRLGGDKFPPNIYYKIFTRRPIVDLCACSPRDYTSMAARHKLARDLHNREPQAAALREEDREQWYKRWENNGWRLVSDRLFQSKFQDPVTTITAAKKQIFHHTKLQRSEAMERKRKQRKIEWLKKMYQEGSLAAHAGLDERNASTVRVATENLVEVTDVDGCSAVEEEDVDELLSWTNALNYEEYVTDWSTSASSAFSDNTCVLPSASDPYEITLKKTALAHNPKAR